MYDRIYKFLLESQYWSKENIIDFQLKELNILLQISFESSAYYKNILKNVTLPLKEIDEFNIKIPITTKDIVKKHAFKLKTKNYYSNFKHETSGSTGDPLVIYNSGRAESYREAGALRFLNWWDVKPSDKSILIWGCKSTKKTDYNLIDKAKQKLRQRYDINVFDLSSKNIFKYYTDINEFKPAFIRGYKSAILQFAELLEYKGLHFDNFKFKVAIVTAEILLDEEKYYIEKILNCKVANEYGCAEVGQIAHECPNGSMHIFEEAVYLNTNENNEVFITELHNDSMPLINYKNNDKVILSDKKCVCGRNSRIISEIQGRVNDFIIKPNGEKLSQYVMYYIMGDLTDVGFKNAVLKYKLYQNKNDFTVNIIPGAGFSEQVQQCIIEQMYKRIGSWIKVEVVKVKSIPRDKSGKLSFFERIT